MARKMTEWPSKRGPITKIMPSDGCIGDTVPLAVGKRYDFHEFGWYMGNVGSVKDWNNFAKSKKCPIDIPKAPWAYYRNAGWVDMGDWLGTFYVAPQNRKYRKFEFARKYVRTLNIKTVNQWRNYTKSDGLPEDIPTQPDRVYKNSGWVNYGDWLGTGNIAPKDMVWRSFKEARIYVHSLNLTSLEKWRTYCTKGINGMPSKPVDIPSSPHSKYKNSGWVNYGDWLGTGNITPKDMVWRPFKEARAFVHNLKLSSGKYWQLYCKGKLPKKRKKPSDIPATPDKSYKNLGWAGMGDWLGTGTEAPRYKTYKSYEDAKAFARSLNLRTYEEWKSYCHGEFPELPALPSDIALAPHVSSYQKNGEWKGWGDFLGTGRVAHKNSVWKPFAAARRFARSLGLTKASDWPKFCRGDLKGYNECPQDIPTNPQGVYRDQGWKDMSDWLGAEIVSNKDRQYQPFKLGRKFARSLNLKSSTEWRRFSRGGNRPPNIPAKPDRKYKDEGWISWPDWLGYS